MEKTTASNIPFVAGPSPRGTDGGPGGKADLCGSSFILTPTKRTDAAAIEKVALLWRKSGKVEMMDRKPMTSVGVISHLPHVLVYALVNLGANSCARCRSERLLRRRI
jgi:prephenate dehydrogenase